MSYSSDCSVSLHKNYCKTDLFTLESLSFINPRGRLIKSLALWVRWLFSLCVIVFANRALKGLLKGNQCELIQKAAW